MKNGRKKVTRAQREAQGSAPQPVRCNQCGQSAPSRYALKEHKAVCRG